jgi:ubiquinone/menaquinone biosynthesis C-methylase UbiE
MHIRTAVNLPARLTIGNTLRDGAMTDLSPRGATLEVEGLLPSLEHRPVHLIFKTAAGTFELQAAAHDRGETPGKPGSERQTSRLALQFSSLDDNQQKVLTSYIEEARARMLAVTVEALFSLTDNRTDHLAAASIEASLRGTDHRETVRVRVSLPVRIEAPSIKTAGGLSHGLVVNFSRGGACLQTSLPLGVIGEVVALHFSSTGVLDQPRAHEPEAPESILTGRIVHITPDHTVPSELKPSSLQAGLRIGIRFVRPAPFAEREVNRVIAQHIGSSMDLASIAGRSSIISTRRECRNARHQVIAVTDDHARHQISPGTPIVLIIPGYGSTQTDYLAFSYYLAANRFRVLRYDHTNHVGQSEGNILQITLRGMQADLQSVFDFVHATWPTAPVALFAEDIAARVAVKVMARSKSAAQLLLLNPILDIEAALATPARPDAIGGYRQSPRRGVANLWGLNVNVDQFVGDVIAGDYADVASSAADFARLRTPPIILTSPRTNHPIEQIFGPQHQSLRAIGTSPVIIPLHADVSVESGTYDERHTTAFRTICKLISAPMIGSPLPAQTHEPNVREVHQQRRLEQERICIRHHVSQATRGALSVAHLAQLPQFGHLPDYWTLINELHRRLLPLEPGMTVLDIGCGLGDFARAMLTNQVYRSAHQSGAPAVPLRYIGMEQSHESLKLAQQQIHAFAQELPGTLKTAAPVAQVVETQWLHTDWTSPLPFIDGTIDRILCHLSLSFTPSPLDCLREALRVLHPDGTTVVTCFQPHTDLSALFQRHLRAAGHDESHALAQIFLHYLGRLHEAIRHGLLHNYERNELARLLSHAGAGPIQIYTVLDNQLLLAIVRKAKSTG